MAITSTLKLIGYCSVNQQINPKKYKRYETLSNKIETSFTKSFYDKILFKLKDIDFIVAFQSESIFVLKNRFGRIFYYDSKSKRVYLKRIFSQPLEYSDVKPIVRVSFHPGDEITIFDDVKRLNEILETCTKEAEKSYRLVTKYIENTANAINNSQQIISDCLSRVGNFQIRDSDVIQELERQLDAVQSDFYSTYNETQDKINHKYEETKKFNITLFGRTGAGKSTLMEILTHGTGASIGKGGQRTTREVRHYEWEGMRVVDVPGIDAYDGKEDDFIAESASTYADLILFLFTNDSPENTQGKWYVKLRQFDKPILCVCNYKQSISDEQRLNRFFNHIEDSLHSKDLAEVIEQFKQFVHDDLPNEPIDVLVTHLRAKFLSMQPNYRNIAYQLAFASQFQETEDALIKVVTNNGLFYRRKCFLSIIDNPLYRQMADLLEFSRLSYLQCLKVIDKIKEIEIWFKRDAEQELNRVKGSVSRIFESMNYDVDSFVETHLEDKNFNEAWERKFSSFNVAKQVGEKENEMFNMCKTYIERTFDGLLQELDITSSRVSMEHIDNSKIINWKLYATIGVGAVGIAVAFALGPLSWITIAIGAISAGVLSLFKSKEKKRAEKKEKLKGSVYDNISSNEAQTLKSIDQWYNETITNQMKKGVTNRLKMMSDMLSELVHSQCSLAWEYNEMHRDISYRMVEIRFQNMGITSYMNSIKAIGRIPAKITVLVSDKADALRSNIEQNIDKSPEGEIIKVIQYAKKASVEEWLTSLFSEFNISNQFTFTPQGYEDYPYVAKLLGTVCSTQDQESILLIEQLTHIHILYN